MRARKYTYIPNSEIESITTWNGKEIPGSKLLDGAYARGKVQYSEGGKFNPMKNSYLLYEGQSILLKSVPSPKERRFLDKEIVVEKIDNNKIIKAFVKETGEKVPFFIDSNLFKIEQYADGGMMAKGGMTDAIKKMRDYIKEDVRESRENNYVDIDYVINKVKDKNSLNRGYRNIDSDSRVYNTLNLGKRMGLFYEITDKRNKNVGYWLTDEMADGGMMGDGGEIRRFDRHKQMDGETRDEILDTIKEFYLIDGFSNLQNYLYGLFDGYDYSQTDSFKNSMRKLNKTREKGLYDRIQRIYDKIDQYSFEQMADGGMMANGGVIEKGDLVWLVDSNGIVDALTIDTYKKSLKGFKTSDNWKQIQDDSDIKVFVSADGKSKTIFRKKYAYADGGMMAKGGIIAKKTYNTFRDYINEAKVGDVIFMGDDINDFKYANSNNLQKITKVYNDYLLVKNMHNGFIYQIPDKDSPNSVYYLKTIVIDDKYADGGMMAKGGYASRHRKRTLEEKAQEMYGSDWFDLDERTRKELIDDLRITKGEKGLIVGDKYVATFTLANGKTIKKSYSTKDELDEDMGEIFMENDVIDYKIQEPKAKEEPKEEKKGIFKLAKITEKTTPKGKEKRQGVVIEGIESDISRYDELKAIMKNAKAESDLIGGRIKEVGFQKWLELYEQNRTNPNSIDLIDGDENIMLQVKDSYKKVEPEKRAILQENYPDLLETTIVYTMDTTLLDKYGEVLTNLINNSKDIEEKDKEKLVKGESTTTIKSGSVDKLLNYPNPEEVFTLIEPVMALY